MLEAPQVDILNNFFKFNYYVDVPGNDIVIADSYFVETVNLHHNKIGNYIIPEDATGVTSPNFRPLSGSV